ncbi:ribonuclease H family protein [Clostridium sp.]|uniref:ribonuclease H family protein n=1 Tax=Clostridium sp. TaxID=1506 RepID=UPI002A90EC63|nr:ribonuclease H family protein [Clostridium sp.]MDY6012613.1 ribonuclease H family protein [Clostridium sp.]
MAKYYSVFKGKSGKPKIFTTWDECKAEVIGCKGAIYKSFKTMDEAKEFIVLNEKSSGNKGFKKSNDIEKINVKQNNFDEFNEDGLIIYVDGSFSVEKGNFSYGLLAIKDKKVIYEDKGVGSDKNAISLRNVSGEVLGAKKAVEYAIKNNYKSVTIVFDYQGIESWAIGTWKRNNDITIEYHEFMKEKMKQIDIRFKKVKGHSGEKYNDRVDFLAKSALGIF